MKKIVPTTHPRPPARERISEPWKSFLAKSFSNKQYPLSSKMNFSFKHIFFQKVYQSTGPMRQVFYEIFKRQFANVFFERKNGQHLAPMQFDIQKLGENRKRRVNVEETCSQRSMMSAVHLDGFETRHTSCRSTHLRAAKMYY